MFLNVLSISYLLVNRSSILHITLCIQAEEGTLLECVAKKGITSEK